MNASLKNKHTKQTFEQNRIAEGRRDSRGRRGNRIAGKAGVE